MNEIYDKGVGPAAQRTVWTVRIITIVIGILWVGAGYWMGKHNADRWWQHNPKPFKACVLEPGDALPPVILPSRVEITYQCSPGGVVVTQPLVIKSNKIDGVKLK